MNAQERRQELIEILKKADKPIIGSRLAEQFAVSRQVIVQDIAILRAAGEEILATSQGYILPAKPEVQTVTTTIACKHNDQEVGAELMTIVEYGAKVMDVIVEHPLYGELKGLLMIQTPADVDNFIENYQKYNASLLAELTDGVHLHTIQAMNEQVINRLKEALREKGFLLDNELDL